MQLNYFSGQYNTAIILYYHMPTRLLCVRPHIKALALYLLLYYGYFIAELRVRWDTCLDIQLGLSISQQVFMLILQICLIVSI